MPTTTSPRPAHESSKRCTSRSSGAGALTAPPPATLPARVGVSGRQAKPAASQSLRRNGLAVLASDAPTADDDLPAVLSPAELRHAVCPERADEPSANDLRLSVWERHVQHAMAAIVTA